MANEKRRLLEQLQSHDKLGSYPFHMPGHKRRMEFPNPFSIDITEIDGFDNLHHPEGILRDSMEWAARVYGSFKTFYLVNGSSGGILSAIHSVTGPGDTIIMGRNCHRSAYHGVILNQLRIHYVYPQIVTPLGIQGGILPDDVERALVDCPEAKAVLLVSPTYDGVVSDIAAIAEIVHQRGKLLIVDEAHGAHFPFGQMFPKSALACGADLVIQSLHKTLPALTQTALLHVGEGYRDVGRLMKYLSMFQTSSPSYVLMASAESCILDMEANGQEWMESFYGKLTQFRNKAEQFRHLRILGKEMTGKFGIYDVDLSKLVISLRNCAERKENGMVERVSGGVFCDRLRREAGLELEMCGADYVVALTSCMDSEEGFSRLFHALWEADRQMLDWSQSEGRMDYGYGILPQIAMKLSDAFSRSGDICRIEDSAGFISAEFIYLYPPGIPIVAPGERITREIVDQVTYYRTLGLPVQGMEDSNAECIKVMES